DDWSLERARQEISRWIHTYNDLRPHHALKGLPPVVYYLGEPDAAYAHREHFVLAAAEARANYWQQNPQTVS
ncbi:MAG TPA: integrase core domain-containing protein, partial [Fimbriimonadaceae bacterium]|nr:integrase core domain-containing protein [Fimbriimonadaceae bacterium]